VRGFRASELRSQLEIAAAVIADFAAARAIAAEMSAVF
jgi:hypothetical protein